MSSPSRPASHALMILSTSSRLSSVSISFSCFFDFASRGTSLKPLGGTIGRSAIFPVFHFSSYSSGSASCTRWPTAHVITYSSDSRKTASSRVVRVLAVDFAASTTSSFVGSSAFFLPRFGLMSSSFRRWKGPSSAPARSRPTEGFSAMTRVLGMQNTIASLGMGAGPGILGRVRPSLLYSLAAAFSWPVVRWLYRLRAEGEENLPAEGGYVLAANHISNLDPWPLGLPLWPRRFLRFMAKSELYWWPLGRVITAGGGFPVRRGERDLEAMEMAIELARQGNVVAMFPHGTRQRKGLVKRYQPKAHTGAARIALEAGVPLVPAAIAGTDRLSKLGPLRVRYGRPILLDDLKDEDPSEAAREATDRLMAEIERLGADL